MPGMRSNATCSSVPARACTYKVQFTDRLKSKFDIDVVVPDEAKRSAIQDMIFKELGANVFHDKQKEILLEAIKDTVGQGASGVIFACTELQFVVKPEDVDVPLWDTMEAHAHGAAEWALSDE
jgi:aspartate racemase